MPEIVTALENLEFTIRIFGGIIALALFWIWIALK